MAPQGVAPTPLNPNPKNVPSRERPRADRRQHQPVETAQPGAIALDQCTAALVPAVEMAQLYGQHGRLDRVETGIKALDDVPILMLGAVIAERTYLADQRLVIRDHRTGIAERPEVLGGIEAERRGVAKRAAGPAAVARAVRLRRILNQKQVIPLGQGAQRIDIG